MCSSNFLASSNKSLCVVLDLLMFSNKVEVCSTRFLASSTGLLMCSTGHPLPQKLGGLKLRTESGA